MRTLPGAAGSILAALCLTACEATAPNGNGDDDRSKAAPALAVAPARLIFRVYAFAPQIDPVPQTIAVNSVGGSALAWSARTTASWITLAGAGGSAPGSLHVGVSRTGLHLGIKSSRPAGMTGMITVSSAGAAQVQIPVSIEISYLPPVKVPSSGNPGCGKKCS